MLLAFIREAFFEGSHLKVPSLIQIMLENATIANATPTAVVSLDSTGPAYKAQVIAF